LECGDLSPLLYSLRPVAALCFRNRGVKPPRKQSGVKPPHSKVIRSFTSLVLSKQNALPLITQRKGIVCLLLSAYCLLTTAH
jgi:hypothetical protein